VQDPSWTLDAEACGRPSVEAQEEIICGTCFDYSGPYSNLTGSEGGDWDLFRPCCTTDSVRVVPDSDIKNRTVYFTEDSCFQYRLTSNTTIANGWDQCVTDRLQEYRSPTNQTLNATYCGRCEYLNKDFLKNGLKSGAVPSAHGMTRAVLLISGLVMLGVMVL
jgi:hypothetical protein